MGCFTGIPEHLLKKIFSYAPVTEVLFEYSRVSHSWRECIHSQDMMRMVSLKLGQRCRTIDDLRRVVRAIIKVSRLGFYQIRYVSELDEAINVYFAREQANLSRPPPIATILHTRRASIVEDGILLPTLRRVAEFVVDSANHASEVEAVLAINRSWRVPIPNLEIGRLGYHSSFTDRGVRITHRSGTASINITHRFSWRPLPFYFHTFVLEERRLMQDFFLFCLLYVKSEGHCKLLRLLNQIHNYQVIDGTALCAILPELLAYGLPPGSPFRQ